METSEDSCIARMKSMSVIDKAREKVMMELYVKTFKSELEDDPDTMLDWLKCHPKLKDRVMAMLTKEKTNEEIQDKDWYFITINPDPKFPFAEVYGKFVKMLKLKPFATHKWIYAVDQRSDESPSGFHIHMVYCRNDSGGEPCKPSVWKDCIKRTLKDYFGNGKHIDIRGLKSEEDVVRCVGYVKGVKSDEKEEIVLTTRKWLSENGYELFYSNLWEEKTENGKTEK